jgi:hypothetical protein
VEPEQENAAVLEEMRRFLAGNPSAVDAGLIAADGHIVVCGGEGEVPPWLENISRLVPGLVANHTRAPLQRMVFEADHGSVVVVFLPDGSALLIAADQQATLGAVASAADRLARTIQQLGSPEEGLSPD